MNAPFHPRTMPRHTFTAWRQVDCGKPAHSERLTATTLPDIERQIATLGNFGTTIFVVEQDTVARKDTLHAYRIRRGKWLGRVDSTTSNKVYPHHADKLFSLPITAFEPFAAWLWTPGCDACGAGDGVIDGGRVS